jgi:tripartite-type tricarboxylate transporter receptor subunit TctC
MKKIFTLLLSLYATFAFAVENVTLIIPTGPGGLYHKYAIELQPILEKILEKNIVVEFHPGANGVIAAQLLAANTKPELSLLLTVPQYNFGVDMIRDITPLLYVGTAPAVIVSRKNLGYNNLKEIVNASKSKPLTFGIVNGAGPVHTIWLTNFKQLYDVDLIEVQYKTGAAMLADIAGGHLDLGVPSLLGAYPLYESGKIDIIATLSPSRSAMIPNIPTVREQGIKFNKDMLGYVNLVLWSNNTIDSKTLKKIQQEYVSFAKSEQGKELFKKIDLRVSVPDIPNPQNLLRLYSK